ncbi:MAG: hypothetical protein H0U58_02445 [Chloroflexi bacterium]|nr:hypothetical protein [Chloroflexota bacterium]
MATATDAARDRVLAARAELEGELHQLEASARAAVDIPARVRRSPGKAAAAIGGAGFLALKGPQRLFGLARRRIRGKEADLPSRMLPDEIEKTLRKLGSDGDKVRGTLERDFADYTRQAQKERQGLRSVLLLAVARPLLARAAKTAGEALLSPDQGDVSERLAQVRERAARQLERARDGTTRAISDRLPSDDATTEAGSAVAD